MNKQQQNTPKAQDTRPQEEFNTLLHRLLRQQKYRQALNEIKKIRRTIPDIQIIPSEADIWWQRAQHEFAKDDFKQAEASFRRALELGITGISHYWLARTLLQQNKSDEALELMQSAFRQGTLPIDYAICYLKLLLLKGDTATVKQLMNQQSKRFRAAHLQWVQGIFALKEGKLDQALANFKKIKQNITPGDLPSAWIAYTQQQMGDLPEAANTLKIQISRFGDGSLRSPMPQQPALQRLTLVQHAKMDEPSLSPSELQQLEPALRLPATVLAFLKQVERKHYHNAAHILLSMSYSGNQWPELKALRPAILALAGNQALESGEPRCTEMFWQPLLTEQPFNPQLAVNLLNVLDDNASYQDGQRLLTRLVKWVEQDKKQHPERWPGDRFPLTLAHLHCRLADTWLSLGKPRTAFGAVQQAERICHNSPEVIGRKGLMAAGEDDWGEATRLLTQALEQGCQSGEVYDILLVAWDELDNPQAKLEARRRFGQAFGDLSPEQEVHFEPWLEALYTQRYPFFSRKVQAKERPTPPIRACQIFVEAVHGIPTSTGKVSLNQTQATEAWDRLLKNRSEDEQISMLMAIALSLSLFTKREKGIAALLTRYMKRLDELGRDNLQAREAYLIVLATKEANQSKLTAPIQSYMSKMPQPGNALAQIQLQVRRFGSIRHLQPFIQEALKREPQNPLLLLAMATTYPFTRAEYDKYREQGFDVARRIQDAKALQAFREEEVYVNFAEAQQRLPNPDTFDFDNEEDVMGAMEGVIRSIFGKKMPKAELDRMMPELINRMMNEMSMLDDDDDFDDDLDMIFGNPKKRRTFRNL